ncbi:hypothetical protein TruAng_012103 [Truncatella angustata]|nr:hypothetical protein TruAng_012103 [Truncatella angustata]
MIDATNPHEQSLHNKVSLRFNTKLNNLLILDWITCTNLPFFVVNNGRWRRQQLYNNPLLKDSDLPRYQTLIDLLMDEHKQAVGPVKTLLSTARSMIHLTFDGWTSRKMASFVGVHAHFIDSNFKKWRILLDEVLAVLDFYGIKQRVGYCTLDNESKNGTCMAAIGQHIGFDSAERQISCAPHSLQLAVRALMYGEGCKRLDLDDLLLPLQDSDQDEDEFLRDAFRRAADMADVDEVTDEDEDFAAEEFEDAIPSDPEHSDESSEANDDYVFEFDGVAPNILTTKSLHKHEKTGPIEKLHNIGNCFRSSSQLVEQWHKAQQQVQPDQPILEWVYNNATRWQSDAAMVERALSKKLAMKRMMNTLQENWDAAGSKPYEKPSALQHKLEDGDWRLVEVIHKILQPFAVASKLLQGTGEPGERATSGGFDEYFPQIETLLDHLEMCAADKCYQEVEDPDDPGGPKIQSIVQVFEGLNRTQRRLLKLHIWMGWWKLQTYYNRMTSLAYAAAVIFNPTVKLSGLAEIFNTEPTRQRPTWKDVYMNKLNTSWEIYKKRDILVPDNLTNAENTLTNYLARRKRFLSSVDDALQPQQPVAKKKGRGRGSQSNQRVTNPPQDELAVYLMEPLIDIDHYHNNPVSWWRDVGSRRFPRLSYMAVDFLTIPSSTAETERQFSSVGTMISPKRSRLRRHLVAAAQCIRSWSRSGVYTPDLPLWILDRASDMDLEQSLKKEDFSDYLE